MNTIYKVGNNVVKFGSNVAISSTVNTGTFDPSNVPFDKKEYFFDDYTLDSSITINTDLANAMIGSEVRVNIIVPNGSQFVINFNEDIFDEVYGITSGIKPPAGKFVLIMTKSAGNKVYVEAPAFYGTSQMVTIPTSTAPTISSISLPTTSNGSTATVNLTANFSDGGSSITDSKIYYSTTGTASESSTLFNGTITQVGQTITATISSLPLNTLVSFFVKITNSKGFDSKEQSISSAVSKPSFNTGLTTATKPPLSSTLRLESKLSSDGGSTITQIGFIYGINQTSVQNSTLGSLQGGVSSQTVPLNGNTTISSINPIFILNNIVETSSLFVKAYAQNGAGVAYSTDNGQPITSYSTTIDVPTIEYTIPNNESGIAIDTVIQLKITANGENDVFYNTSGGILNASTGDGIIASLFTLTENGTSKSFTVIGKSKSGNQVTITIKPNTNFDYDKNIFVTFGNVYDSLNRPSSNNLSFKTILLIPNGLDIFTFLLNNNELIYNQYNIAGNFGFNIKILNIQNNLQLYESSTPNEVVNTFYFDNVANSYILGIYTATTPNKIGYILNRSNNQISAINNSSIPNGTFQTGFIIKIGSEFWVSHYGSSKIRRYSNLYSNFNNNIYEISGNSIGDIDLLDGGNPFNVYLASTYIIGGTTYLYTIVGDTKKICVINTTTRNYSVVDLSANITNNVFWIAINNSNGDLYVNDKLNTSTPNGTLKVFNNNGDNTFTYNKNISSGGGSTFSSIYSIDIDTQRKQLLVTDNGLNRLITIGL